MYKYLSIVLSVLLLIGGVFYLFERHSRQKAETALNNEISKLQGMVKETESVVSARGIEIENLKSQNGELQKIINRKDEDIAALGKVVLQWKDKYYKIANANGSITDGNNNPVILPPDCEAFLKDKKIKVEFTKEQDNLQITGFTIYPNIAEIKLHWTKPLTLDIILTKDKSGHFKIYIDPNDINLVPTELTLKIDPSVFNHKWYEKIQLNGQVAVGNGVLSSIGVGYDVLNNISVGPNIIFMYDGNKTLKLIGASVIYYPFRS